MGTEPRCQQLRGSGGRGTQGAERRPCPPLTGTRPRLCVQGCRQGHAVSRGQLHGQLADRQSMTPTGGDAHGAETSVADMREGAIFSEGRGQSGARGGRRASGGWGAGSVGENAPRPPASPPPARGEAEGRRDGHTDPQQDRGWAIPWGPVTRSYVLTDTHSTVLSTQGHTRHTGHTLQQVVHTWTRAPGGSQVGSLRWC